MKREEETLITVRLLAPAEEVIDINLGYLLGLALVEPPLLKRRPENHFIKRAY